MMTGLGGEATVPQGKDKEDKGTGKDGGDKGRGKLNRRVGKVPKVDTLLEWTNGTHKSECPLMSSVDVEDEEESKFEQ